MSRPKADSHLSSELVEPSRGRLTRTAKVVGALAGVILTAAACGSSSPSANAGNSTTPTTQATSSTPTTGATDSIVVKTASVSGVGTALVDAQGFTLYTYSLDKPGVIACTGHCTSSWPPLLVPSGEHLANMSGLSTVTRPGGDIQVAYNGKPLYTFSGDTKAGQDNGKGIPNWSVATTGSTSGSTTTSTSASSPGYGGATTTTAASGGSGW
ncbi:MAG: hypothetical protein ABSD78_07315 [Acidimicrobiales bacterium]|jgi:predicted lipoprotein with Yx(FWY)xxD motif